LRLKFVSKVVLSFAAVLFGTSLVLADSLSADVAKLFPEKVGLFHQSTPVVLRVTQTERLGLDARVAALLLGGAEYKNDTGKRLLVEQIQFRKDADAYSFLTRIASEIRDHQGSADIQNGAIGTSEISTQYVIAFYKGRTYVHISSGGDTLPSEAADFAKSLAEKIDSGEGDIPVLLRHLPDWQNAQKQALFVSGIRLLSSIAPSHHSLTVLDRDADADAVVATYGPAKLVLIEFNTPQLAADNDREVLAKLQELRSQNQPLPSAYRRVGNYAVFVFDAPSEQAAKELIDQIKYEQVVQWLGENPYWFKEAQRRYTETTLGVLVAVVKASGLTLIGCFGLGGLIGTILFARRRARQTSAEAFSDAGGMLRLNLDEMTPQTDPARLLTGRN
jgi:hypothetical protein